MWSRRSLLRNGAAGAASLLGARPRAHAQSAPGAPKHLIVVLIEGGWDVTYCLDPKEGCPDLDAAAKAEGPSCDAGTAEGTENIEKFGNLTVATNALLRPGVAAFFGGSAVEGGPGRYERCHIINGIETGSIAHDPCRTRMLTGTQSMTNPDISVIAGAVHGGSLPLGSVDLSGWSVSGSLAATTGRIGYQSQIKALVDPNTFMTAPPGLGWSYPLYDGTTHEGKLSEYLLARQATFLAQHADGGHNDLVVGAMEESLGRAALFKAQGASLLTELEVGEKVMFYNQINIAISLIQAGVCHSLMLDSRYDWDTHEVNLAQHDHYEGLFRNLAHLYDALEEAGLFEDTVVAVISEMTRTPLMNLANGKDHWPHTSALLFGGGVKANQTSGATDSQVESQTVDLATGAVVAELDGGVPLNYDNFCAGILDLVGVNAADWLPDAVPFEGFKA